MLDGALNIRLSSKQNRNSSVESKAEVCSGSITLLGECEGAGPGELQIRTSAKGLRDKTMEAKNAEEM
jgi:hypothetical protein